MTDDTATTIDSGADAGAALDPTESIDVLLRHLRGSRSGLTAREATRRLISAGPNELRRRGGRTWPKQLTRQFTHPLALLLWAAAGLAALVGIEPVAIAVVVVIVINAVFAFAQERHAERAVEALAAFLPMRAKVVRDGRVSEIDAVDLVPGDVLVIEEGDRISADARLIEGGIEVDLSALTGESLPVFRSADLLDTQVPFQQARDLVFSGTTCTEGDARAVVFATGMHTELGRIAALSERVSQDESPLEIQVRRVAWLIALISILLGAAFIPIATFGAGLSFLNAMIFAVGLLVGNVPEGLLPVITLALAIGVRDLAKRGAVIKRLSSVETLGSTDVICTDKTGTLTENRMRVTTITTRAATYRPDTARPGSDDSDAALPRLVTAIAACNNASIDTAGAAVGDPTEIALLRAADVLGGLPGPDERDRRRRRQFHHVVWHSEIGELWRRTININLNRALTKLGKHHGVKLRASYGKVAEYQRRAVVHIHALIRIDQIDTTDPDVILAPPPQVTTDILAGPHRTRGHYYRVRNPYIPGTDHTWPIQWGSQIDIRPITGLGINTITAEAVAGYLAKYATKTTEPTGLPAIPRLTDETAEHHADPHTHIGQLIAHAWQLGDIPQDIRNQQREWLATHEPNHPQETKTTLHHSTNGNKPTDDYAARHTCSDSADTSPPNHDATPPPTNNYAPNDDTGKPPNDTNTRNAGTNTTPMTTPHSSSQTSLSLASATTPQQTHNSP